ncbi:MAG TPA: hypothetical protein DEW46_07710 [Verrucomicrobia bacterium]|jgi:hypothetical protein|nr:hypothetical protein [Verrucomicrobiota bacterium]
MKMIEAMAPFLIRVGSIVGAIIGLKVFFTLWKILEKRLHPEQFSKPPSTPETAFRGLKGKKVVVQMKSGDFLQDCEYKSTLFFGDGEFSTCTLVYFELEKPDGNRLYVCGSDILKIETKGKA